MSKKPTHFELCIDSNCERKKCVERRTKDDALLVNAKRNKLSQDYVVGDSPSRAFKDGWDACKLEMRKDVGQCFEDEIRGVHLESKLQIAIEALESLEEKVHFRSDCDACRKNLSFRAKALRKIREKE